MTRPLFLTGLLLCAADLAAAQQHQHGQSPYAGLEGREIKALSEEQVQQLRGGEGMSLALAAELNHYPGPRHVLDLASELSLTKAQQEQVRAIQQAHQPTARELGEAIVERERRLDQAFAKHTISPDALRDLTMELARLQGELRYTHLEAHVALRGILSEQQIAKYDELRGYREPSPPR